ncbi:MAG: DUF5615 family PIN-like protein [Cyanobacteria bacterium P01_F01_bin.143]
MKDASINSFVLALRNLDFDVVTTAEAENLGFADPEQLIWASKNHRVIYTFNRRKIEDAIASFPLNII